MLRKQYFSGDCSCGHHYRYHHKMYVARPDTIDQNSWIKEVGGSYADECLICNGVNGNSGLGDETGHFCYGFFDVEDPLYLSLIHPTD